MVVGTSKTFRSLARICGAAPYSAGPHVKREMHVTDLRLWTRRMEAMAPAERADLPGVPGCAPTRFSPVRWRLRPRWKPSVFETMRVSPWALREGLILRRLEHLAEGTSTPLDPKTLVGE